MSAVTLQNPGPADWLCVDCETNCTRPEAAEEWARRYWTPDRRWTDETVGKRWREAVAKKSEKLALLDVAQIVCIGARTSFEIVAFHCMAAEPPRMVEAAPIFGFGTEREMLLAFREYLNARSDPETVLTGHNLDFDLKRIRFRLLAHGLQLPPVMAAGDQPHFCTMRQFARRFSLDAEAGPMIGLGEVLSQFSIPCHKDLVDGADIGALVASGQRDVVIKYCLLDTLAESECYLRMTGRSASLA